MELKKALLDKVVTLVSETLDLPPRDVAVDVNIQELGFGSVTLVSFVEKLSAWLGDDVHPGVFFEHSTLDAFVGYLLEHKHAAVERALAETAPPAMNAPATGTDDAMWQTFEAGLTADAAAARGATSKASPNSTPKAPEPPPQNVPVIVGGGIGGMLISRALCKKNIRHVLVGSSQLGDSPKLGESMTEACTIEFTQGFEGYEKYLFKKDMTPFFMGDIVAGLRFDFFGTMASLFENDAQRTFIHVDRIGFDQALFDEVSASPQCHWIDSVVTDVEHDAVSDRITSVQLKSGETIAPTYVWDCTNHVRLLGRKLAIPYEDFDAPRQVIFTHYYQKDGENLCQREDLPWMHATTLLRAHQAVDGLEGVSWFIPLGSYVSVGISLLPSDIGERNPEEIVTALTKAYQIRGLDYTKEFSRRKEIVSVPSQHFMYDRCFGNNWSLVGGSAAGTWFTSGSQLSMPACMASMADKIIEQPKVYGEHYSRHVRGFARTQTVYDTLLSSNIGPLDAMKFLSGIVDQARRRISSYYMFRKGLESPAAHAARELWEEQVVVDKQYFEFLRQIATHVQPAQRKDQAAAIFEKLAAMKEQALRVRIPYLRGSNARREKAELFL